MMTMATDTVCIPTKEYETLKRKEAVADDLLVQLEASLLDLQAGRIKRVR